MTGVAGLVATVSVDDDDVAESLRLMPWRGLLSGEGGRHATQIRATGSAAVASDGPVSVVMHGWLDEAAGSAIRSAEALLMRYRMNGVDALRRLDGGFAAVVVDEKRKELHAVRDWMGTRPLFFSSDGSSFAVASEAWVAGSCVRSRLRPDERTLGDYIARRRPAIDASFVADVHLLPANSLLTVNSTSTGGTIVVQPANRLSIQTSPDSNEAAKRCVRSAVERAVSLRSAGSPRLAALASGGVDSGVIAALTASTGQVDSLITHSVKGLESWEEADRAAEIAAKHNVTHCVVRIDPADTLDAVTANVGVHGPLHPTAWLSGATIHAASRHHDTLLTGHLGDEWLTMAGGPLAHSIRTGSPRTAFQFGLQEYREEGEPDLIAKRAFRALGGRILKGHTHQRATLRRVQDDPWIQRTMLSLESFGCLADIRVETPFADRKYVNAVLSLTPMQRNQPGRPKAILRDAFSDVLPQSYVDEPVKANFYDVPLLGLEARGWDGTDAWDHYRQIWAAAYRSRLAELGSSRPEIAE